MASIYGQVPLHVMCVLLFLHVCAVTDPGQTPLDIAEEEGNEECVQLVSWRGWMNVFFSCWILTHGVCEATFVL